MNPEGIKIILRKTVDDNSKKINIKSVANITLKSVIIFLVPLFFAENFIYRPFSSIFCVSSPLSSFTGVSGQQFSLLDVEKSISNYLVERGESIKNFDPILPINEEWLKPDVYFKNNLKLALIVSYPESYNEVTTTSYINTKYGSSTIEYGKTIKIASRIGENDFKNLITNWGFDTNIPNKKIIVGAKTIVQMQENPKLGEICVLTDLPYKKRIYVECLIIWAGLFLLSKEVYKFINKEE